MRILALSDTHIGAGYDHRQDALGDTAEILAQIAEVAISRGVDLILHAGDVFHRSKPAPAELHCFKRFCEILSAAGIPMVAVTGNGAHEAAHGDLSALELFSSRWVRVSRRPEVITEFAGVAVCTLPATPLEQLTAASNREQAQAQAAELIVQVARDLFAAAPSDRPRILLAHQMVSGASLPTGLPVEQVGSVVLPLEELEAIGYDAIVLGDIHRQQVLGGDEWPGLTHTWYCGSPMCMDFGEASDEHGVWLMEFEPTGVSYKYVAPEFVPLADRRFVTVDVDLTQDSSGGRASSQSVERGLARPAADGEPDEQEPGMRARTLAPQGLGAEASRHASGENAETSQDPIGLSPPVPGLDETDRIAAAIAEQLPLTDAVVRVRYRASEEQHRRVDHHALAKLVADAGAHKLYGGIQWLKADETRARAEALDESVGPLEAIDLWLAAQSMNGADGAALRTLTAEYLEALR